MSQVSEQKPNCAVRGVLYGGRAICGSVINASKCGYDGSCEHKRCEAAEKAEPKPDQQRSD